MRKPRGGPRLQDWPRLAPCSWQSAAPRTGSVSPRPERRSSLVPLPAEKNQMVVLTIIISFSLTSVLILLQVALPVYLLLFKIRFWPLGKSVFFLSLIISFLSGALSVADNRVSVYFLGNCRAVSVLISPPSCPAFLQGKHRLPELLSPYCFPNSERPMEEEMAGRGWRDAMMMGVLLFRQDKEIRSVTTEKKESV